MFFLVSISLLLIFPGDLNEERQMVRVAQGGFGGHPDNHFLGQKGQVEMVTLDLKLLADVGLVG